MLSADLVSTVFAHAVRVRVTLKMESAKAGPSRNAPSNPPGGRCGEAPRRRVCMMPAGFCST